MFSRNEIPKQYQRLLEEELERAIIYMKRSTMDSEEYAKTLVIVERLHGMLDEETSRPMSKDTMATVGANLLGILMIIKHESVNVITSKALSFVIRPR
jgi:hypothetical protein